jgi:hypothetical protein
MRAAVVNLGFLLVTVGCGKEAGPHSQGDLGGTGGSGGEGGGSHLSSGGSSGGAGKTATNGGGAGGSGGSGGSGGAVIEGGGSGGSGGKPAVELGGDAEPWAWSRVDMLEHNGFFPTLLPDSKGGVHVVAQSTHAKLLNYSTAGWVVGPEYAPTVGEPQVLGDPTAPLVVWQNYQVEAVKFDSPALGQTPAEGPLTGALSSFGAAANSAGDRAVAFWADDLSTSISATTLKAGAWSPPQTIGTGPNQGIARVPRGAMDDQGRAVVIWHQQNGVDGFNERQAVAAIFDGNVWQPSAIVGVEDKSADLVNLAVNRAGKGFGVWGEDKLYVRPIDLATGFGETVVLAPDATMVNSQPTLAVNAAGEALIVWSREKQFDFAPKVVASFRDAAGKWTDPLPLEDQHSISEYAAATLDDQGRGAVAWVSGLDELFIVTYTKAAGFSRTTKLYPPAMMLSGAKGLREIHVAFSGTTVYVVCGGNDGNGNGVVLASHAALP